MNRNHPKIIQIFRNYRFTLSMYQDQYYVVKIQKVKNNKPVFSGRPHQLATLIKGEKLGHYSGNYILEGLTEKQLTIFNSSPTIQDFIKVVEQCLADTSDQPLDEYYDNLN